MGDNVDPEYIGSVDCADIYTVVVSDVDVDVDVDVGAEATDASPGAVAGRNVGEE
jgi:hypothetical protein